MLRSRWCRLANRHCFRFRVGLLIDWDGLLLVSVQRVLVAWLANRSEACLSRRTAC